MVEAAEMEKGEALISNAVCMMYLVAQSIMAIQMRAQTFHSSASTCR